MSEHQSEAEERSSRQTSDLPIDDVLDPDRLTDGPTGTDPEHAYDGGWEQALEEGDGLEDHLLGEKPTTGLIGGGSPPTELVGGSPPTEEL